jgi:hypothetical protein
VWTSTVSEGRVRRGQRRQRHRQRRRVVAAGLVLAATFCGNFTSNSRRKKQSVCSGSCHLLSPCVSQIDLAVHLAVASLSSSPISLPPVPAASLSGLVLTAGREKSHDLGPVPPHTPTHPQRVGQFATGNERTNRTFGDPPAERQVDHGRSVVSFQTAASRPGVARRRQRSPPDLVGRGEDGHRT